MASAEEEEDESDVLGRLRAETKQYKEEIRGHLRPEAAGSASLEWESCQPVYGSRRRVSKDRLVELASKDVDSPSQRMSNGLARSIQQALAQRDATGETPTLSLLDVDDAQACEYLRSFLAHTYSDEAIEKQEDNPHDWEENGDAICVPREVSTASVGESYGAEKTKNSADAYPQTQLSLPHHASMMQHSPEEDDEVEVASLTDGDRESPDTENPDAQTAPQETSTAHYSNGCSDGEKTSANAGASVCECKRSVDVQVDGSSNDTHPVDAAGGRERDTHTQQAAILYTNARSENVKPHDDTELYISTHEPATLPAQASAPKADHSHRTGSMQENSQLNTNDITRTGGSDMSAMGAAAAQGNLGSEQVAAMRNQQEKADNNWGSACSLPADEQAQAVTREKVALHQAQHLRIEEERLKAEQEWKAAGETLKSYMNTYESICEEIETSTATRREISSGKQTAESMALEPIGGPSDLSDAHAQLQRTDAILQQYGQVPFAPHPSRQQIERAFETGHNWGRDQHLEDLLRHVNSRAQLNTQQAFQHASERLKAEESENAFASKETSSTHKQSDTRNSILLPVRQTQSNRSTRRGLSATKERRSKKERTHVRNADETHAVRRKSLPKPRDTYATTLRKRATFEGPESAKGGPPLAFGAKAPDARDGSDTRSESTEAKQDSLKRNRSSKSHQVGRKYRHFSNHTAWEGEQNPQATRINMLQHEASEPAMRQYHRVMHNADEDVEKRKSLQQQAKGHNGDSGDTEVGRSGDDETQPQQAYLTGISSFSSQQEWPSLNSQRNGSNTEASTTTIPHHSGVDQAKGHVHHESEAAYAHSPADAKDTLDHEQYAYADHHYDTKANNHNYNPAKASLDGWSGIPTRSTEHHEVGRVFEGISDMQVVSESDLWAQQAQTLMEQYGMKPPKASVQAGDEQKQNSHHRNLHDDQKPSGDPLQSEGTEEDNDLDFQSPPQSATRYRAVGVHTRARAHPCAEPNEPHVRTVQQAQQASPATPETPEEDVSSAFEVARAAVQRAVRSKQFKQSNANSETALDYDHRSATGTSAFTTVQDVEERRIPSRTEACPSAEGSQAEECESLKASYQLYHAPQEQTASTASASLVAEAHPGAKRVLLREDELPEPDIPKDAQPD